MQRNQLRYYQRCDLDQKGWLRHHHFYTAAPTNRVSRIQRTLRIFLATLLERRAPMSSDSARISCLLNCQRLDVTSPQSETRTLYHQITPAWYQSVSLANYIFDSSQRVKCHAFISHQCIQALSAVSIYVTMFRDTPALFHPFSTRKAYISKDNLNPFG